MSGGSDEAEDGREALVGALERLAAGELGDGPLEVDDERLAAALRGVSERLAALEERAGHLQEVLDRLPVGFFRNSLVDGRVMYCNQRNAELLGYPSPAAAMAAIGRSTTAYVHPEERALLTAGLVRDGAVDGFRTAVWREDGTIGYVEVSARLYPKEQAIEGVMIDYAAHRAREEEVTAANEALRQRNAMLEDQRATILELSMPVVEVWERVLCVPLIGNLDSVRTLQLIDGVLERVRARKARAIIVDMTGIDSVDTTTAHNLVRLARAVRLLGSRTLLCGIRSEVAQTFVILAADLSSFEIHPTLKEGLAGFVRADRAPAARS